MHYLKTKPNVFRVGSTS